MAESIIPKRPSNDGEYSAIKANDRDCLSYAVAFNVPNERAFALFHPEFLDESGKLTKVGKQQCRQFFSYAKNKEYADAYKTTLESFTKSTTQTKSATHDTGESRMERAVKKLVSDVLDSIEYNNNLDPEALKDFVEVAKKLGVLKDEEEKAEAARRYLPARCLSECAYRLFCEQGVVNGDLLFECDYCRTRKFAEENGWKFDPIKNLDLPTETKI